MESFFPRAIQQETDLDGLVDQCQYQEVHQKKYV